ncbi:MAG: DEAD/DEAH box helicase family protein [Rhizobium sp.]|nr:DEAD/DEAH box helicase family protein [Rhizobium sp.]
MAPQPEQQARGNIDRLLEAAGWHVCDASAANIHAARGVAIREFPLPGYGFADYLLYVDGKAAGVIEAKKEGVTLTGVETQSDKYTKGLPAGLPRWSNPLPFSYQTTGVETRFTNGLDPTPRSRPVFAFHKPELLAGWLNYAPAAQPGEGSAGETAATFLAKLQAMPPLKEEGLWPAQITAIHNLEKSLKENRPRALIQMATGSGKTFTSISFIYRLIKFAGARRILFLVDRGNLADQTLKEFQQYVSPYNNFKFSEEYIVQRLQGNQIDTTARVCICTLQRMYSMLKGRDLPADLEEESVDQLGKLFKEPEPIEYNPAIPIETFDIIVTDEAHRSIYNLWAQVLEYFDAYLVGLTATPGKQTFGFFHQNLMMEYNHEMAVADGVNVNYDVYRIKTAITEGGSKVEAGYYVEKQERDTRKTRWEELDDDFAYDPNQLDRDVVTPDQIRTIVRTFKDKLFSEIFPGRTEVPKTLIFAKDDNLKRYKAAVLKAAVEGRLVETEAERARREGRSYETGAQLLQRILEARRSQWQGKGKYKEPAAPDTTDLPELPEGWVWASAPQLAEVRLGKMLDKQKHKTGTELPYLRNINVRWGSVETGDLLTMYFKDDEVDRYALRCGDVLVCEGGEPGRAAVWDGRMPTMKYQKALHRVRFFPGYDGRLLVVYLEYLAKSGQLERWFTGSTIKHFTGESFASLPIPMPPILEQGLIIAEIERRLSLVDEAETQVNANLQRTERMRQSILQTVFSVSPCP